jgi:hypothetical protein
LMAAQILPTIDMPPARHRLGSTAPHAPGTREDEVRKLVLAVAAFTHGRPESAHDTPDMPPSQHHGSPTTPRAPGGRREE